MGYSYSSLGMLLWKRLECYPILFRMLFKMRCNACPEDSEYVERALETTVRLTGDCLALREQQRVQEAALRALRQVEREQTRAHNALEHVKRDKARDFAHTHERRDLAEHRFEELQEQMEKRCDASLVLDLSSTGIVIHI